MISLLERANPVLPQDTIVTGTFNKLGQGSQSVVFEGTINLFPDPTPLPVALKVDKSTERIFQDDDKTSIEFDELDFLNLLSHEADEQQRIPHTLRAYGRIPATQIVGWEAGTDEEVAVVELLEGENLSSMLQKRGPLPPEQAFFIMQELLYALTEIQGVGYATPPRGEERPAIVHGDIKPSNIYVVIDDEGQMRLKLNDFGVARFQEQKIKGGTLGYQPPEQVSFGDYPVAPAKTVMDTHGAIMVFYELLTGHRLLTHYKNNPLQLVMNMLRNNHLGVMKQQLEARGINPHIIQFILRGVTNPPQNNLAEDIRYQDAIQMQEAFEGVFAVSEYQRRLVS